MLGLNIYAVISVRHCPFYVHRNASRPIRIGFMVRGRTEGCDIYPIWCLSIDDFLTVSVLQSSLDEQMDSPYFLHVGSEVTGHLYPLASFIQLAVYALSTTYGRQPLRGRRTSSRQALNRWHHRLEEQSYVVVAGKLEEVPDPCTMTFLSETIRMWRSWQVV